MRLRGLALALSFAALTGTFVLSCGGNEDNDDLEISIRAEVTGQDAAVEVSATPLEVGEAGRLVHEVRVTWRGEGAVFLNDARFNHHVQQEGSDLVLAGRGCGAEWSEEEQRVVHVCNDDLQIPRLEPGETHAYPVAVYRGLGPLKLDRAGTYVAEERVRWWSADGNGQWDGADPPDGEFTIRLSYEAR